MDNTIIQQGNFTSDGTAKILRLRSDVDWVKVFNRTVATNSQTTAKGVEYMWLRGYADGAKWTYFKSNAANAANLSQYITSNGFTLINSTENVVGALNATITAVSAAAIPVVSNSGTNGLSAGDVVRIIDVTGAQQLGGIDFTVGNNTLTSGTFSLDYMSQIVAGTTGSWRKINFDPMFYPAARTITKVSKATSAVVTFSVTHGYKVGQIIKFNVPAAYGMTELDGLNGTITAVSTANNTVTVDIDSSTFTTFAWPLTAEVPFTPAEAVPAGMDTAEARSLGVSDSNGATLNTGYIGLKLTGGANNPGGASSDKIDWIAGKSFSVDNQI